MVKSATTIAERLKELAESRHDIKVSVYMRTRVCRACVRACCVCVNAT